MTQTMVIHLVVDPDTRNQREYDFNSDYEIEEVRWEEFKSMPERIFAQQDAFVGDSVYPALFLNSLTCKPHITALMPDGGLYISVETLPLMME